MRSKSTSALLFALALSSGTAPASAAEPRIRILVQASPLAGSQFHALPRLQSRLRPGDRLDLVREPDNPHYPFAVRVEWQGHMLGYVPRKENRAVAAALDRGTPVSARITRLTDHPDPWQRLAFEILVEL
ncbi:MAG: HIRAN domain-containing protein [Azovibrio sp.]|nr:HIRAN domain-containing protein [Azovibrio sp.]